MMNTKRISQELRGFPLSQRDFPKQRVPDDLPVTRPRAPRNIAKRGPQIVGTVHSRESLKRALQLPSGAVDYLELRIDCFAKNPSDLLDAAARLKAPLIATVRHDSEGGAQKLSARQRRDLFAQFLPFVSMIDVELRSAGTLAQTIGDARARKVRIILSSHHFRSTPSTARLEAIVRRAAAAGADIIKIATSVSDVRAVQRLLPLLARRTGVPLSVMGMGVLGKVSRLLFASAGSLLNYGYLGQPQVDGQWEATLLKARIAELL